MKGTVEIKDMMIALSISQGCLLHIDMKEDIIEAVATGLSVITDSRIMILEDKTGKVCRGTIIMRDLQETGPLIVLQEKDEIFTEIIQDTTKERLVENTETIILADLEVGANLNQVMREGIGTAEAEGL